MTQIALFHSALGVRAGVTDAAARLGAAGHDVLIVDQYDGRVFDSFDAATAHVEAVGFPALMTKALDACVGLDDGFVVVGFSNGGGMAEWVATQRSVAAAVLLSGTLPIAMLGADTWPTVVPVQTHYAEHDPYRNPGWVTDFHQAVRASGAVLEHFDYPGSGHLFTDPSLPTEFDHDATEMLWPRVLRFCAI